VRSVSFNDVSRTTTVAAEYHTSDIMSNCVMYIFISQAFLGRHARHVPRTHFVEIDFSSMKRQLPSLSENGPSCTVLYVHNERTKNSFRINSVIPRLNNYGHDDLRTLLPCALIIRQQETQVIVGVRLFCAQKRFERFL
jgi:hypothetical protein